MAELGIVASGMGIASLAIQIGDCIVRLKGFCDAVKGAPEEIKHLIEEIETLSFVLSGFETNEQPELNPEHEATAKCFQLCKKAIGILDGVVKDAEAEIKKRKRIGSVKAVLKRDVIEKLRARLMTAQSMLMLSNNDGLPAKKACLYRRLIEIDRELQKRNRQAHHDWAKSHRQELQLLRAIVSQSTETIISSIGVQSSGQQLTTRGKASLPTPPVSELQPLSPSDSGLNRKTPPSHSRRRMKLRARFQTPKWLFGTSRVVQIYESLSNAGWDFTLQVYNVVPRSSPIFRMIDNNDIEGVKHLLSTGQASPFDRTAHGATLLDFAAFNHNLELCRLLKNEGANPNVSSLSSVLTTAYGSVFAPTAKSDAFFDLIQFLAKDVELQDPFEDGRIYRDITYFNGNAEVFAWILQASNSTHQQRSPQECASFALGICRRSVVPHMSRLVRIVLKGRLIDKSICSIRDHVHYSLLHHAAWYLGQLLSGVLSDEGTNLEDCLNLIHDLVQGGSDLNALTISGRTPMLEFLWAIFHEYALRPDNLERYKNLISTLKCSELLHFWLKQLKDSGVDLIRYGEEENRILESPSAPREYTYWKYLNADRWSDRRPLNVRLIHFTYGPDPEDWRFWLAPVMEDYFIEFWEMIDHPERAIPGAWPDLEYC